jgi:threonine dehydrogenase-like Zn-dependent dehydrogenase
VARYAEAESVLVIGAGPIGIGAVALLHAWGTPRVYVSEFSAYRRQRAEELGAITIDPGHESLAERLRAAEPDGVDLVFLAVGSVPAIGNLSTGCGRWHGQHRGEYQGIWNWPSARGAGC